MMKRILIATAMIAAATPAMAADTTTQNGATVAFSGNRPTVCEIRNYENIIQFGELTETGSGATVSDSASIYCNVKFRASITSQEGFLRLVTGDSGAKPKSQADLSASSYDQFASALNYKVSFTGIGVADTSTMPANSAVSLSNNIAPMSQSGTITYSTIASAKPLLAGHYSDSVTLTLTPLTF